MGDTYKKLFTVYLNTTNGTPGIKWESDVPSEWKVMLKASFGNQFTEITDEDTNGV